MVRHCQIDEAAGRRRALKCLVSLPIAGVPGIGKAADRVVQPLRFVTIALPPFGMTENDVHGSPISGIYTELVQRLAQEAGLPFTNTVLPYARAVALIEAGEADAMISFANQKLLSSAVQLEVAARLTIVAIGRAGEQIASIESLRGKIVGMVREAEYDDRISQDAAIVKAKLNNYEQGIALLFARRVDALIGVHEGIVYCLHAMGHHSDRLGVPLVLSERPAWLHYSRKRWNESRARSLVAALRNLHERNTPAEIVRKYLRMGK